MQPKSNIFTTYSDIHAALVLVGSFHQAGLNRLLETVLSNGLNNQLYLAEDPFHGSTGDWDTRATSRADVKKKLNDGAFDLHHSHTRRDFSMRSPCQVFPECFSGNISIFFLRVASYLATPSTFDQNDSSVLLITAM